MTQSVVRRTTVQLLIMQLDPSSFYGSVSANENISQVEGRIDSIKFPQVEEKIRVPEKKKEKRGWQMDNVPKHTIKIHH